VAVIDTYPEWADRARLVIWSGLTLYLTIIGLWVAATIRKVIKLTKGQTEEEVT